LTLERDLVAGAQSVTTGVWERLILPQGGVVEIDQRSTVRVADAHHTGPPSTATP
jgi:hypothetical protein